jgi:hypothetical protein
MHFLSFFENPKTGWQLFLLTPSLPTISDQRGRRVSHTAHRQWGRRQLDWYLRAREVLTHLPRVLVERVRASTKLGHGHGGSMAQGTAS